MAESGDFEPRSTRNTTFLGGIFDTVKMKMSQSAFRKIMPKSDDEDDVHQFELQQMMDLPDGILRQKLDLQKTYNVIERLDTGASELEDLFFN